MHFDGPMVAGGHAYSLDEILEAEPPATLPTGLPPLDQLTRGIQPGSMWTITGAAGVGVSSLALTIAANAATAGDVIVCNGHIATRTAAYELARLAIEGRRPRLASWYGLLPDPPEPLSDSQIARADVLIVDTWDESWHAAPWPASRSELTRRLRWLRQLGRERNTAILLTARAPLVPGDDVLGWMSDAFADVADVNLTVTGTTGSDRLVLVHARGVGRALFHYPAGATVRLVTDT